MIEDEERPVSTGHLARTPVQAANGPEAGGSGGEGVPPNPAGMSGADFQVYIGRGLRAVFDDVAKQPIPDRFLELMKKLG